MIVQRFSHEALWVPVIGVLLTPLPFRVELHALFDVLVVLAAMLARCLLW